MPPPPVEQSEGQVPPSTNLWVGNLAADVTEADLTSLFSKHGALDSVTLYTSKSYGFVHFKRVEDAKAARGGLQGYVLRGIALKIEFAKPAKQCKSLWVGGIGRSVTKEVLEERFRRFGKLQEFKFLRDRNTAFVDYFRIEDATEALKNLNGISVGGAQLRVDYLRSHPTRREQLPDSRDGQILSTSMGVPDSPWIPQDFPRNYPEPVRYGSIRPQLSHSSGDWKGDGQPSNVLRVLYPPSFPMDEQMLHNAMILFGEIESIRSFTTTKDSYVEFRSIEEAIKAKEGLQGRLFNDPRISIMFSNSEIAPNTDKSGFYLGIEGKRPDLVSSNFPFRPGQLDIFSHNHAVAPNSFSGQLMPRGVSGPGMLRRPLGPQGSFETRLPHPDLSEYNPNIRMGGPNQKRLSPAPGVLSSPSPDMKPSSRPGSGTWDVFDPSQLQRESKRPRTGGLLAPLDSSLKEKDNRGLALDQFYGRGSQVDGGISGAPMNVRGVNHLSPEDSKVVSRGNSKGHPELDNIWRGVIAKGGNHVCRARCVPVEKEVEFEIPEVVNCSARTGLDMLTKHYGDAVGYNVIFFLPDSVDDFAPYTEFLRLLGSKSRAGVAKFDDGTTLFLVPPSDFLTNVLNITGPERLYGVVLKFPQHAPGRTPEHQHFTQRQYIDRPMVPPQTENCVIPQEERFLQTDFNRALHKNPNPPLKSLGATTSNSFSEHAVQPVSTSAITKAGVTLTPELIATLASLLPTNGNSSGPQPASGSSMPRPALTERGNPQGWNEEPKVPEQSGHVVNQLGNQYNPKGQFPSQLHYSPSDSAHQIQDSNFSMPHHGGVPSRQAINYNFPAPQVNQQYQLETPRDTYHGYGQGTNNASGLHTNSVTLSHQVHGTTSQLQNQVDQFQSAFSGADQGMSEVEDDKNERYQSTLQFAASLLHHIQQQPSGTEAAQGRLGSH